MRRATHQDARRRAARAAPRVSLIVTTLIVPGRDDPRSCVAHAPPLGRLGIRACFGGAADASAPSGSNHAADRTGSGGWLESACKLILAARAGILLLTLFSLTGRGRSRAASRCCSSSRRWRRSSRCATGTGSAPRSCAIPPYLAAELMLTALILLLTPVQSPFFYFTLGTALLGGLLYGYAGAAVFSLLLVAVYFWSLDVRSDVEAIPDTFQTYVGLPALYPLVAAAGAAARRLLDRQAEAEAELAEEQRRRGGGGRARAAGARHARLAGQDRVGHRLRRARALAPDRARPAGRGGGGAPARRRRAPGDAPGARDHRRAARRRRRVAPATSALAMRARRWAEEDGRRARPRDRGGRRAAPADRPRARVDPRRGARERQAPRAGRRGSACGCAGSARARC